MFSSNYEIDFHIQVRDLYLVSSWNRYVQVNQVLDPKNIWLTGYKILTDLTTLKIINLNQLIKNLHLLRILCYTLAVQSLNNIIHEPWMSPSITCLRRWTFAQKGRTFPQKNEDNCTNEKWTFAQTRLLFDIF